RVVARVATITTNRAKSTLIWAHTSSSRLRAPHLQYSSNGRYRLSRRKHLLEEYFDGASDEVDWAPRYNIAPTQPVPVIRQHPKKPVRDLSLMKWGLVPSWAKDPSVGASMINARSETAHELPAFRDEIGRAAC